MAEKPDALDEETEETTDTKMTSTAKDSDVSDDATQTSSVPRLAADCRGLAEPVLADLECLVQRV
jgi:hypothetical protein